MTTRTEATSDPRSTAPDGNRIVVGVDGSKSSLQALRWARYLARNANAVIEVISAWQVPAGWNEEGWADEWSPRTVAENTVRDAIESVLDQSPASIGRDSITGRAACGSPAELLIQAGKGAAMIVVGSRGHGGFTGLLLGSVSSAVAEHAPCPVLVVHGDGAPFGDASA